MEKSAKSSQKKVNNLPIKEFQNANKLVQYMDKCNLHKTCEYDVTLALKTITEIEKHPDSKDVDGVDMT